GEGGGRGCQRKGKRCQLNLCLAAFEGFGDKPVDLFHLIIGHGVTADRAAAGMHHKKTPGSSERSIKGIGKTNIKSEILTRVWIHLRGRDVIKSFRRLMISLHNLRPKFS